MSKLNLQNKVYNEGRYHSRDWKYESSTKYVFSYDNLIIEAGYFEHFIDDEMLLPLKRVIELSTSYGCQFRCKYCASSSIRSVTLLTPDIVFDVFSFIYDDNGLNHFENIEVSFLGIGDAYYTIDTILSVIPMIISKNNYIVFNVSSCYWTKTSIAKIEKYRNYIKTIQMTYLSFAIDTVRRIIPGLPPDFTEAQDVIHILNDSMFSRFRINYIMIKDLNDSDDDFLEFLRIVSGYKEKTIVRISKMNMTNAARSNQLQTPEIKELFKLDTILKHNGVNSYVFYSFQDDNMNCGQLITEKVGNDGIVAK